MCIRDSPHPDHYGGLRALSAHLPIDELWISGDDPGDPRWDEVREALAVQGTRVVVAPSGTRRERGGASVTVLAPERPEEARGVNDDSLLGRLDFAGRSVLFAGDLEAAGEADALASVATGSLRAAVVKVPHHGSATSSTEAFVAATRPLLAVVSCGRKNRFRFPAPEVVKRWTAAGARVLRTDQEGAVTVILGGDGTLRYSRWASR